MALTVNQAVAILSAPRDRGRPSPNVSLALTEAKKLLGLDADYQINSGQLYTFASVIFPKLVEAGLKSINLGDVPAIAQSTPKAKVKKSQVHPARQAAKQDAAKLAAPAPAAPTVDVGTDEESDEDSDETSELQDTLAKSTTPADM